MRFSFVFSFLLLALLTAACDSKPGKPPTPSLDAPPAPDKTPAPGKAAPRDEPAKQTGY